MSATRPLCLLATLLAFASSHAAVFSVSTPADSGPGSLRQAIIDANASTGPHSIEFGPALSGNPIAILSPLPLVSTPSLLIDGTTALDVSITGTAVALFELATTNREFTLRDVTLSGAQREGGGACLSAFGGDIANPVVTLESVRMTQCDGTPSDVGVVLGGAVRIINRSVSIRDSRFFDNYAYPFTSLVEQITTRGGAVFVRGNASHELRIENSSFEQNLSQSRNAPGVCGAGGALVSEGVATIISDSRFIDNSAECVVGGNSNGGALRSDGNILIENSLFFRNRVTEGGANTISVFPPGSELRVFNSTFVGNIVGPGSTVSSVAAYNEIRNNSFMDNLIGNNNTAFNGTHFTTSTFAGTPATLWLTNNLFGPARTLDNPSGVLCRVSDGFEPITSGLRADNLFAGSQANCGSGGNVTPASLRVAGLGAHGGAVETLRLAAGSSALNRGTDLLPLDNDPVRCRELDGRKLPRPGDGAVEGSPRCDVGAYESQGEASLFRSGFSALLWHP